MEKSDKKDKMTAPPPRKGKVATALRNNHSEQLLKLQVKHQQDVDFLEDIRLFTKMRATIEKDYAQSLLKLATTYLQRKYPTVPEVKSGDGYKDVYGVWKTLLDETEKIAKARLAATEVYQQQVSEGAKSVRIYKLQVAKKCFDNLRKMQDEIQQCVVEIDKSKKLYFEEEHMAHDAREKAHDADEKLKRKKGRIFQSISSLQKNSAKFSFRREACDIQATKARNDYVLALVAANAHQTKYYDQDLPELIQLLDCDIYDKVKEYILLISRTELLTCAACQSSFTIVQEQADMATKQYTMECYYHDNPVLSQALLYEFEPCDNDQINKLSIEHNAGLCLSKEARRWATCVAKETRVIRDCNQELKKLNAMLEEKPQSSMYEQGPQIEVELRIDELRQIIRRAQTSKKKAEARLDAMRESGVNVDEWMRTSDSDSTSEVASEVFSRSGTVTSRTSQQSYQSESYDANEANEAFYDSDNASEPPTSAKIEEIPEPEYMPELTSAVDVVAAVQSAWDAAAETEEFDEPEIPEVPEPVTTVAEVSPTLNGPPPVSPYAKCVALFSYQATNSDEISFVEQEELELIGESDSDGWIKAKNCKGDEGYIPQNYVEVLDAQQTEPPVLTQQASFSSVDYSMPQDEQQLQNGELSSAEENALVNKEIEDLHLGALKNEVASSFMADGFTYCRATYDYEATCDEELTFFEDQIIKLLRKNVTDVDDGWWEGECDGKIGLFPSLVVVELKDNGEPLTPLSPPDYKEFNAPPELPPPTLTPPEQQLLLLPAQVILTQPTPEIENPLGQAATQKLMAIAVEDPDFKIELSGKQASQYQQQFSASDSESSEREVVAVEEVPVYAPLVSSPDADSKAKENAGETLDQIEEERIEEKDEIKKVDDQQVVEDEHKSEVDEVTKDKIEEKEVEKIEQMEAVEIEDVKTAEEIEVKIAEEIEVKTAEEIEVKTAEEIEVKTAEEIEVKTAEEVEDVETVEEVENVKTVKIKIDEVEDQKENVEVENEPALDAGCPTVVISEAPPNCFEDEFIYEETEEDKQAEEKIEEVKPAEDIKPEEIVEQNPDAFECHFPDTDEDMFAVNMNESSQIDEKFDQECESKSNQQNDEKMDLNNDAAPVKSEDVTFKANFETTG